MKIPTLCLLALLLPSLAGCFNGDSNAPSWPPLGPGELGIPYLPIEPVLDTNFTLQEWGDALLLSDNFTIQDGSEADGTYPFDVWIGYTEHNLNLAFNIRNVTPIYFAPDDDPNDMFTPIPKTQESLYLFFSMGHNDKLTRPSELITIITFRTNETLAHKDYVGYSETVEGYWNGRDWVQQNTPYEGSFNEGRPRNAAWGRGFNTSIDNLFWEIAIPRYGVVPEYDGLKLDEGSQFSMSILFQRHQKEHSPDAIGKFRYAHDSFPGDGYTPNGHYKPQDWLRLQIRP